MLIKYYGGILDGHIDDVDETQLDHEPHHALLKLGDHPDTIAYVSPNTRILTTAKTENCVHWYASDTNYYPGKFGRMTASHYRTTVKKGC